MSRTFDLTANARPSRVLGEWVRGDAGRARRVGELMRAAAGVQDSVSLSDSNGMRELLQPVYGPAGYPVTEHTAMLVSTVFACLTRIAGAVTQLPVQQYRGVRNANRDLQEPNPLWWMLNESPVPGGQWTAASWKEWIVRCVHLRGDQHTEILRGAGGSIVGLKPHHPDCSRVTLRTDGTVRYDFQDPATGKIYGREADDVLHFTGFGFDGLRSLSVIQYAARNAVGNSLAGADFVGRTLGEGAMPKIALKYPNNLSKEQKADLREAFVATYGGPANNKLPLVLTGGADVKELSIKPVDLELLASRLFEKHDICQAMGVPPILIGESEKTSSWGTGIEQIMLGFVKLTVTPHLKRWEEEMNRKLYRRAGVFLEFDLDGLLRGDGKAQAEFFRAALGGPGTGDGWMSINEVRRMKNQPRDTDPASDRLFRANAPAAASAATGV